MHDSVLVTLIRGGTAESEHRGAYCVVREGRVVRSAGNVERPVFWRSAAKPIQALAVVETGACDRFGLTEQELAITVGSHDGSPLHAEVAASILAKAGEGPEILRCGGHPPLSKSVAADYIRQGITPGRIHDNCSGKHAGMIAGARALGAEAASYAERDHPVQKLILENVALCTGLEPSQIVPGTDGCAAPSFGVPLRAMARAAALFTNPNGLPEKKAEAARRVQAAVAAHPEMIAGPRRLSSHIVRAGAGRLIAKSGAEGVYFIGVAGKETGIAVKIADGTKRALNAVVVTLLEEMELVEKGILDDHFRRQVLTREGDPAGEVRVTL